MKMKGGYSSPKGLYSKKDNPMSKASQVKPMTGPSKNPDCQKANRLLQKAQSKEDSLRGTGGAM